MEQVRATKFNAPRIALFNQNGTGKKEPFNGGMTKIRFVQWIGAIFREPALSVKNA